jgi:hypothetical protein
MRPGLDAKVQLTPRSALRAPRGSVFVPKARTSASPVEPSLHW